MRAKYVARGAAGGLAACALSILTAGCQQTVVFEQAHDGGDGSSINPGDLCPNGQMTIGLPVPSWESPRVILALDRSSTMSTTSFGAKTELVAAEDALENIVAKYEAVVKFAYTEFPRADFNCNQSFACCASAVMSISDSNDFHRATHFCDAPNMGCPMSGERPIAAALGSCKDFFMQSQGPGKRYVLLVTDGAPTPVCSGGNGGGSCPDEATIVSQLGSATRAETAIVALDLPDDACLGQLGATGRFGQSPPFTIPPYYASASSPDDLAATLESVVGTMAADACTLDLTNFPGNLNDVFVFLDGVIVQQGTGWQFTDSSHIKLSGTACQSFVDQPANLNLVGCTSSHPH